MSRGIRSACFTFSSLVGPAAAAAAAAVAPSPLHRAANTLPAVAFDLLWCLALCAHASPCLLFPPLPPRQGQGRSRRRRQLPLRPHDHLPSPPPIFPLPPLLPRRLPLLLVGLLPAALGGRRHGEEGDGALHVLRRGKLCTHASLCLLFLLRLLLHFRRVMADFAHPVGVNYLFAPSTTCLLLLRSSPFLRSSRAASLCCWLAFCLPICVAADLGRKETAHCMFSAVGSSAPTPPSASSSSSASSSASASGPSTSSPPRPPASSSSNLPLPLLPLPPLLPRRLPLLVVGFLPAALAGAALTWGGRRRRILRRGECEEGNLGTV